ncbi:hypothetical protein HNS25_15815, partial [Escherichia coli]|nr:hypothetical protein [Escherichia coli]MCR2916544.1 hypothetical protein [Escherichia coli]
MPERLPLCTPFPFDFEFFVAVILLNGKRAARTVLTGMCYSVGSATRQGEQFADPVYRPVGYDVKDIA